MVLPQHPLGDCDPSKLKVPWVMQCPLQEARDRSRLAHRQSNDSTKLSALRSY